MAMPYLTLNGVSTATALPNAVITALPVWRMARKIYHSEAVSERDGQLFLGSTTFDNYSATVRLNVPASDLGAVFAFFNGGGWMVTSAEPGVKVYVRVLQDAQVTRYAAGDADVTITLDCEPIKHITPDAADIVKTSSGGTFVNPGTYWSQPRIYVNGSGAFTVTISNGTESSSMFFSGVPSDGIVLDSEKMDAFNAGETQLLNGCVLDASDDFFRIYPGVNTLTWTTGGEDESGTITSVTITPRWRNI